MERSVGSSIWYVLKAERRNWFDQGCKKRWWQSGEGADAGSATRDGWLLLCCECQERRDIYAGCRSDTQRAKHIFQPEWLQWDQGKGKRSTRLHKERAQRAAQCAAATVSGSSTCCQPSLETRWSSLTFQRCRAGSRRIGFTTSPLYLHS